MSKNNLFEKLSSKPFFILGPCVIESEKITLDIAQHVHQLSLLFPEFTFVFKASFDKANRTSIDSYRGPGLEASIPIFKRIQEDFSLFTLTDIHQPGQAEQLTDCIDIFQIPAFLCRQTDLLLSVAQTGKVVNIKKGQFLSHSDIQHVVTKITSQGNDQVLLTERGTMFGYNNLVVDYAGMFEMSQMGYPVVFDATHSVQKPGGQGNKSGGNSEMAPILAKAAAAIGIKGFFMETHPDPDNALSDGPNMIKLDNLKTIIENLRNIIVTT
jgi:2-dehydro-3-deoxyphosphooctonate aldolase (KDO 8-P synthase)